MSPDGSSRVPARRAPAYASTTWGPYYDTLHPPGMVHMMIAWKAEPLWMDNAARLWRRRQELRQAYEATYGLEPAQWPHQHPGVVLGSYAACLGCHWLHGHGYYRADGVFQYPADLARRHEASNGAFRGDENRLQPTARPTPSPAPVQTSPIPRRTGPIPPLRVADRYSAGRLAHRIRPAHGRNHRVGGSQ